MAIAAEADLVAALSTPINGLFVANGVTAGSQQLISLFRQMVSPNVALATPSVSGAALDRTAKGALNIPGSGAGKAEYLTGWGYTQVAASANQFAFLYDRLVETGGLDSTVITAQTVNSASLPTRNTTGVNCDLDLEIYATIGATGFTATASYTNSAGTSGRIATVAVPGSARFATAWRFTLQAGDVGVQSVQSITCSASSGTAGNIGIVIRQQIGPMIHFGIFNPLSVQYGWTEMGIARIADDACVEIVLYATAVGTNAIHGWIQSVEG